MNTKNLEQVREKLFSTKDPSQKMNDEIKNSAERIKEKVLRRLKPSIFNDKDDTISDENYQKVSELSDFISQYVKEAGKEQAILDFQVGLNLLNGYKKSSQEKKKIKLEEDSDFGEKTFAALFNVFKNYPVDVVKKFVKLGAINNRIWNTKNNKSIDTDSEVEKVTDKLNERGY